MSGKLFMVMAIRKEIHVGLRVHPEFAYVGYVEKVLPLDWAKGMVGAIPVFDNEEDALAYAGDKFVVMEIGI